MQDVGEREGKFYAINVPLKDGIDDASFTRMFRVVSELRYLNPQHEFRLSKSVDTFEFLAKIGDI